MAITPVIAALYTCVTARTIAARAAPPEKVSKTPPAAPLRRADTAGRPPATTLSVSVAGSKAIQTSSTTWNVASGMAVSGVRASPAIVSVIVPIGVSPRIAWSADHFASAVST